MLQKRKKKWKPSEAMERFVDYISDPDTEFPSLALVAEAIDVKASTIRGWFRKPEFTEYLRRRLTEAYVLWGLQLDKQLMANSGEKGDYMRMALEKITDMKRKIDITSDGEKLTAGLITYN